MKQYLDLMSRILNTGEWRKDRTGTGTIGLFGEQLKFDLREGFPLLTTKKLHVRAIFAELQWMLMGRTDNDWLNKQRVWIWNEWSTPEQCARFGRKPGDLGPIYGHQWRNFGATLVPGVDTSFLQDGLDQLARLVEDLQTNPWSRRHIVTAWNPKEADTVALPPCHTFFQCRVSERPIDGPHGIACELYDFMAALLGKEDAVKLFEGRWEDDSWLRSSAQHKGIATRCLDLQLYQRSADYFLGVPFNIASYALLLTLLADLCGYQARTFTHTFGDVHLYSDHLDQARLQLSREPRKLPTIEVPTYANLESFRYEDVEVVGYDPHPAIKAKVSV